MTYAKLIASLEENLKMTKTAYRIFPSDKSWLNESITLIKELIEYLDRSNEYIILYQDDPYHQDKLYTVLHR